MNKNYLRLIIIPIAILTLAACGGTIGKSMKISSSNGTDGVGGGGIVNDGGGVNSGAGAGAGVSGKGSLTAPTAEAVIVRIQNGLESSVSPQAGNFARTLAQVKSNLPKVTDPLKSTGFDQVQLLAYGACSDLTTGNTPIMQTKYGVTKAGAIAAQQAALVAAGVKMLDQHVAGLASQSSATAAVNAAFTSLVQKVAAVQGNTSTIAFMAVCIAANTAGSSMMSF